MNTMTTGQLAAAIARWEIVPPTSWELVTEKQAQARIRKAVENGHLIPCGKIGNYNLFDNEAIQQWVNGGCRYASKRVNEEAGE